MSCIGLQADGEPISFPVDDIELWLDRYAMPRDRLGAQAGREAAMTFEIEDR
jgi:hypothetical protein